MKNLIKLSMVATIMFSGVSSLNAKELDNGSIKIISNQLKTENVLKETQNPLLKMSIYKINSERIKEIGISKGLTQELVLNNIVNNSSLLEQDGIVNQESSIQIGLIDKVTSELKLLKESGKFVVQGCEEKSTFESNKVGTTLTVLPKIDLKTKTVTIDVDLKDTKIVGIEKANFECKNKVIELEKDLIKENQTKQVIELEKDLIKENQTKQNVLLTNENGYKVINNEDTFIVMKVEFPN